MPLPSIAAAAAAWQELLEQYDIPSVLSLTELDGTACVVIRPPRIQPRFAQGSADLTWTFLIVAGDNGPAAGLEDLGTLLSRFSDAVPNAWQLAQPVDVAAGPDLGTLPGYQLTITQTLES